LYAHRLKIFGTDEICIDNWLLSLLKRRTPLDLKRHAEGPPGKRKSVGQTDRLDSRQGLDAREQFLEISAVLWRPRRVFGKAGRERERQYAIGVEAFGHG